MSATTKVEWPVVSTANPCPVCHRGDRCKIAPNGDRVMCFREPSPEPAKGSGPPWYHPHPNTPPHEREPRVKFTANGKANPKANGVDWNKRGEGFRANLAGQPAKRQELADALRLPVEALDAMPGIGWNGTTPAFWSLPETDAAGAVVGINRRFEDPALKKRHIDGGRRGLTLPLGWSNWPGPVYVCEGASDALALTCAGLPCVGRFNNAGGADMLAALFAALPAEREIIILGESDEKPDGQFPGRDGARSVAAKLRAALPGRPIRMMMPPEGVKDARAFLTDPARDAMPWEERGAAFAAALVPDDAPPGPGPSEPAVTPAAEDNRPVIIVGVDEHRVNAEAAAALAADPDLFQRDIPGARGLVAVEAADGRAAIVPVPAPVVRDKLTQFARFVSRKFDKDGAYTDKPVHPPDWCAANVPRRGDWPGVRRLDGVVGFPVLGPSGRVLTSGYDADVRLFVAACGPAIPVPDSPTPADARDAARRLLDLVAEFPFRSAAHRAAWLAALLTGLARPAFAGPAPFVLIDANAPGSGKGLLAHVLHAILTGRDFPVTPYPGDGEELRKCLTGYALAGTRLVLFDNLAGRVGSPVFDAAVTGTGWNGRVLGANASPDLPLAATFYATGNNVQLYGDLSRRTLHVRLDSPDERPDGRSGYRYPDLLGHVRANRPALLADALTVLLAWVRAGRPAHGLPTWGSFEAWSGVVREAVVFADLPDPAETRAELRAGSDRDTEVMRAVLDGLAAADPRAAGLTAAAIVQRADGAGDAMAELRAALDELCGARDVTAANVAYRFRGFAGRNFGGLTLRNVGPANRSARWAVCPAVPPAGPGTANASHPSHPPDGPGGWDGGTGGIPPGAAGVGSGAGVEFAFDHSADAL